MPGGCHERGRGGEDTPGTACGARLGHLGTGGCENSKNIGTKHVMTVMTLKSVGLSFTHFMLLLCSSIFYDIVLWYFMQEHGVEDRFIPCATPSFD